MNWIYLITIIIGLALQNITKKVFAGKTEKNGEYTFSLISCIAAMLFFIITSSGFEWNVGILPYAGLFAVAYTLAVVSSLQAVSCGSLSLTSLITSYSLMLPTLYGMFFLKDPIKFGVIVGVIFLIISLFMINQKQSHIPITPKWILYVIFAFVGNGMCSVFQKMQQVKFDGGFKNEFMILSLAISIVILCFFVLTKERKDIKVYAKNALMPASICGIMNGVVNLFVMILSNLMPISIMFPMISAGGIIVTYLTSLFLFKEKLTRRQFIGFIIGIGAVVFLNI